MRLRRYETILSDSHSTVRWALIDFDCDVDLGERMKYKKRMQLIIAVIMAKNIILFILFGFI